MLVLRFTNDAVINDLGRVVAVIHEAVDARRKTMPLRVSYRSYPPRARSARGGTRGEGGSAVGQHSARARHSPQSRTRETIRTSANVH